MGDRKPCPYDLSAIGPLRQNPQDPTIDESGNRHSCYDAGLGKLPPKEHKPRSEGDGPYTLRRRK